MTDQRDPATVAAEQAGVRVVALYAAQDAHLGWDVFDSAVQHAALDAVTDARPHIEQAMRARIAAYIDRAAERFRRPGGGLSDGFTADCWAQVAEWCRDDSIWNGEE